MNDKDSQKKSPQVFVEKQILQSIIEMRASKWGNFIDKSFSQELCQENKYEPANIFYTENIEKDKKEMIKWLTDKSRSLEEPILIFNEKILTKENFEHISKKLIAESLNLRNNFFIVLIDKKDAGISLQADNLLKDNVKDGMWVMIRHEKVYACILKNQK